MMQLVCENICKEYKKKEVLHNLSLTIEEGKIYGLIGRNGAGKTTLLSILTAQNPASSGTVTLDGEAVWENAKALENLCFSRECLDKAIKNHGLERSLKTAVPDEVYERLKKELEDIEK